MDHLIPNQKIRPSANKQKRELVMVDFANPVDHRVKIKESEKIEKYLDLAQELKKTVEYADYTDTNFS